MLPTGHAAVGYLAYSLLCRHGGGRPPTGPATLVALFGTQLPDLVDKPLAWLFFVLPTGRTFAHSLLTAGVVLGGLWYLLAPTDRRYVIPLGVGWVSHTAMDVVPAIALGDETVLGTLLWPVTSVPPYDTELSFVARLSLVEHGPFVLLDFALVALAFVVWDRDGRPGLATLRSALSVVVHRITG
ncbi:metal-dependent hydrolase [Halostella salina]|uniref:metal-dependent hydrolase n=1 Tax=Halostella salina TaxID=1547897 RepID=UPI000EF7EF30|nr:metal-dependent hydrolase [Halostella salina]